MTASARTSPTDSVPDAAGPSARTVIVGCGRWSMGDDQAGLCVAEKLRSLAPPGVAVYAEESPGCALGLYADDADHLIIIDAAPADNAHPAGTFTRVAPPRLLETVGEGDSTHQIGVCQGLALLRALGRFPRRLSIYAVFGHRFHRALSLSPEVSAAVDVLAERIVQDLSVPMKGGRSCTS